MTRSSFSLIIPAYNEEARLGNALTGVLQYLRDHFSDWEMIYVDDGSTDNTYSKLAEYQNQNPELRILRHPVNRGKGRAVRTGLEEAKGDLVLFSDADFSTPIEDVEKLLFRLSDGFDIAIASRGVPGANVEIRQSIFRDTLGKLGNVIVQSVLLLPFEDTQCGFKLYKKAALKEILPRLTVDGFAFDMEMLLVSVALGFKVVEVPVTWRNVLESKVQGAHILEVLRDLLRIRYRFALGKYS